MSVQGYYHRQEPSSCNLQSALALAAKSNRLASIFLLSPPSTERSVSDSEELLSTIWNAPDRCLGYIDRLDIIAPWLY